ncbi:polysaccharide biosynthesis/export family protein [Ruegeria sp. HKCCA6837]|uniref:polysaccharide biosynthesis/export family protein n=1 Tax=Ruegeria sp. HKCCA6837 TaxID=2682989 RepID=UPI0014888220|nr:polysaccharide biosynthesis/export family protein [Ruegeria sp. HKCCA6837]
MRTVLGSLITLVVTMVVATSAWAQSYQIQPGDALQVEVLEDPTLNRTTLVLPDGSINFPLAGSIRAAGQSTAGLSSSLSSALASNFNSPPTVFISIASLAPPPLTQGGLAPTGPTIDVFAMGEVGAPGRHLATEGTTILQFLAQVGGLTNFAAQKRIELRRADSQSGAMNTYIYNYKGSGSGIKGTTVLKSGDVVVVPSRRLFE